MLHAAFKRNIWDERPLVRATKKNKKTKKQKKTPKSSLLITPRSHTRSSLALPFTCLSFLTHSLSLSGLRLPWWNTPG